MFEPRLTLPHTSQRRWSASPFWLDGARVRALERALPQLQWLVVDVLRGARSVDELAPAVFRFLVKGLGHGFDHLYTGDLLEPLDAVTIPGGDDLANRFVVEVKLPSEPLEPPSGLPEVLRRHDIAWLVCTNGAQWRVSRVHESPQSPVLLQEFDVLQPMGPHLLAALWPLTLEGLRAGALKRLWESCPK